MRTSRALPQRRVMLLRLLRLERSKPTVTDFGLAYKTPSIVSRETRLMTNDQCEKCGTKREESTLYIRDTATGEGAYMLRPCQKCKRDSPKGDETDG